MKRLGTMNKRVWSLISLVICLIIWQLISVSSAGAVFASPKRTLMAFITMARDGTIWVHIGYSLFRVLAGFTLGLLAAIPIAFLMGWYKAAQYLLEPVVQFIRTIPPIAYIPLVIVALGVDESSKVMVIFIATFLVMVITIYQGVKNVDSTLVKAARVLGAGDKDIFFHVVVPASFPFVLTAIRLGLSAGLTTLIASELTGASKGLGTMIQEASMYFRMDVVIMGIMVIGIIGLLLNKIVHLLERWLTGWQETHQAT